MMLELQQILNNGQKVVSGKERGINARGHFKLDSLDVGNEPIEIVIPDDVRVITPSFLLGMLSPSVVKMGSVEKFLEKYTFRTQSSLVYDQIKQGVKLSLVEGNALGKQN